MKTVLLTEPIHPDGRAVLAEAEGIEVRDLAAGATPEEIAAAAEGVHGILVRIARLPEALIAGIPTLEVISKHGVGTDNIPVAHCSGRGIPVAVAADANARSVAEHTLAMILAGAKRLVEQDLATRAYDWKARGSQPTFELAGKTLLIVGLGRIGARVARLAQAFEMRVLGHDPHLPDRPEGVADAPDLDAALAEADVVTLHCPLDDATRGLIGRDRLARLKPGALLINNARGGIVDEAALLEARPGFYGADVFRDEPIPPGDPLMTLRPAIFTPHSAAMTAEGTRAMAVQSAENVVAALEGRLDPRVTFNRAALGL